MNNDDKVNLIIAYETGEATEIQCLELFSALIKSGECWTLQGHYGCTANALIENGVIDAKGEILL